MSGPSSLIDRVEVIVDLERLGAPQRMGFLHRQTSRGDDVYSFEFDKTWLQRRDVFSLDPGLTLISGRSYPAAPRKQFGVFLDSSPDRWGRTLMQRREALHAAKERRPARTLSDWDYLLGVHDSTRLGALRFRVDEHSPYLDNSVVNPAPPIASLRELQSAAWALEQDPNTTRSAIIEQLLAPGSSLGGARPKASVVDEQERLCIAKFPSRNDEWDMGAWEYVTNRLAKRAGLSVPDARVLKLTEDGHTYISRRFDRNAAGNRLAFVSAMTVLQREDGDRDVSYLELIDVLQSRGAITTRDCEELFRRVVFNICISNTDDHLRNHGFIAESQGLTLSPAFDINPSPHRQHLTLRIDEHSDALNLEVAESAAEHYGLSLPRAREVIKSVKQAAVQWRDEAQVLNISRHEQELMSVAFANAARN